MAITRMCDQCKEVYRDDQFQTREIVKQFMDSILGRGKAHEQDVPDICMNCWTILPWFVEQVFPSLALKKHKGLMLDVRRLMQEIKDAKEKQVGLT